jgi:hypothetical protein
MHIRQSSVRTVTGRSSPQHPHSGNWSTGTDLEGLTLQDIDSVCTAETASAQLNPQTPSNPLLVKRLLSRYSDGLPAGQSGFVSRQGQEFSFLHNVWGPPSLLPYGYLGLFPREQSGRGVKLTTHLQLVPRSRMVELYLHTSSRRGA